MNYSKLLLFIFLLTFLCCKDEEKLPLLSNQFFELDSGEHFIRIGIQADGPWHVEGDTIWCKIEQIRSAQGDSLFIRVAVNVAAYDRKVVWKISDGEKTEEIQIRQAGATGEYHYQLPTVFHILNQSDYMENKELEDRLLYMLGQANKFFAGENRGKINVNVEFVPVTTTPLGAPLRRPGIHWEYRKDYNKIEPHDFINNVYGDAKNLWNPNKYINIYIFYYYRSSSEGVSALPWTSKNNALEGLYAYDLYYQELPDNFIPCLTINQSFLFGQQATSGDSIDTGVCTLTHELGHYLGLLHAFDEDYCEDTPSYDREMYDDWWLFHFEAPWEERVKRTAIDGSTFISTNFEDYEDSYMDEITSDQRKRIRHVLNYSPLIPGPKIPVKLDLKSKDSKTIPSVLIR